ncbi:MAG: TrbC/VirB2 family protein [Rhodobacteraceae bacterium]|nr:TrbC/VirB2 family protein [Paracoccaceae bacterium]
MMVFQWPVAMRGLCSVMVCGLGSPVLAAGATMPWDGPLDRIVDNLTGPFALAVGVLGLVVLAVRILFGEQFGQFARSIINVIIAVAMITGGAGLLRALIPQATGALYFIETLDDTDPAVRDPE